MPHGSLAASQAEHEGVLGLSCDYRTLQFQLGEGTERH